MEQATGAAPSPKIEAIRAFTREGFTLIPLRGKIPTVKAWVDVTAGTYGEAQLADKNYGIALKASDLILDVDPRNFRKDDPMALTRLCALVPGLAAVIEKTLVVRTGGGGLHIYFSKPADLRVRQVLADFPGIEIKSAGRQIVGPFSIHPDTQKPYEIIRNSPATIAEAPAGLLELSAAPAASTEGPEESGTGSYVDDEATRGRYEAFLLTAPAAIEGKSGDLETFKVACQGRDLGLPPKTTWELMLQTGGWNARCVPPWAPDELKAKVAHAYRYGKGKVGSKHPSAAGFEKLEKATPPATEKESDDIAWNMNGGKVTKSLFNLMNYLKWKQGGLHKLFGYNQFTGRTEFLRTPPWRATTKSATARLNDDDFKLLRGYLADKHDFEVSITDVEHAVTVVAHKHPFHPVREYLEGLKWDGVSRLDWWLRDYLGVEDNEYTRAVARKTLCAAVTRVFRPGAKFDHVLVLEGGQGIGKSSAVKILAGEWVGSFPIDPHSPTTVQLMQGKWIIEIAELEFKGKAEEDAVKAFVTRETDQARFVYQRIDTDIPRQSIFIASKNPASDGTFLKDETGGRRWWPVTCAPRGGKVDFKGLKDARDQLFAEALERVRTVGEALFMETAELTETASAVVDLRRSEHPWVGHVGQWLDSRVDRPQFLTGIEIFTTCLGAMAKEFNRREQNSIASVMRSLGWVPDVQRVGEHKRPTRGYCPKEAKKHPEKKEDAKGLDKLSDLY